MSVCYLLSTMQGYDGSLMGAVNAMKPYQHSFGLSGAGRARADLITMFILTSSRIVYWSCVYCLQYWLVTRFHTCRRYGLGRGVLYELPRPPILCHATHPTLLDLQHADMTALRTNHSIPNLSLPCRWLGPESLYFCWSCYRPYRHCCTNNRQLLERLHGRSLPPRSWECYCKCCSPSLHG